MADIVVGSDEEYEKIIKEYTAKGYTYVKVSPSSRGGSRGWTVISKKKKPSVGLCVFLFILGIIPGIIYLISIDSAMPIDSFRLKVDKTIASTETTTPTNP